MDILQQLNQIAVEKDVSPEELLHEIEESIAVAYKKFLGTNSDVAVHIDPKEGWTMYLDKEVVGMVTDPRVQISLMEARKRKADAEIGDFMEKKIDPNDFGRIAAQTFKQVLSQKLREAETRQIHDVFHERMGEVVSGTVSRKE